MSGDSKDDTIVEIAKLNAEKEEWRAKAEEAEKLLKESKDKIKMLEEKLIENEENESAQTIRTETPKRRKFARGNQQDGYTEKNPTCGCKKCLVEVRSRNGLITTGSINIAAGLNAANRLKVKLTDEYLLIFAQNVKLELEDQTSAIIQFAKCPCLLEYLENFEHWKNAVEKVRFDVNSLAKPQPIEVRNKTIVLTPKMDKAKLMLNKEATAVYLKDSELEGFWTNYELPECKLLVVWISTRNDVVYFLKVKEMLEKKPKDVKLIMFPLPLQGHINELSDINELFKTLGGISNARLIAPEDVKTKNGLSITATLEGGPKIKHDDIHNYIKSIKKAIPEEFEWFKDQVKTIPTTK